MAQQTAIEYLFEQLPIRMQNYLQKEIEIAKEMEKEQSIAFHKWMLQNDTEQNAEKYFQYSDGDMWNEFLNIK